MATVIQEGDPLSAGAEAAGAFQQSAEEKKRYQQAQQDQANQEAEREREFEQTYGLEQKRVGIEQQQADTSERLATIQEKTEALNEVREKFDEQMRVAEDRHKNNLDFAQLALQRRQLDQAWKISQAEIAAAKTQGDLNRANSLAIARLQAATEVQVANIHAAAESARASDNAEAVIGSLSPTARAYIEKYHHDHPTATMADALGDLNKAQVSPADRQLLTKAYATGKFTEGNASANTKFAQFGKFGDELSSNLNAAQVPQQVQDTVSAILAKTDPARAKAALEAVASGTPSQHMTADQAKQVLANWPSGAIPSASPAAQPQAPGPARDNLTQYGKTLQKAVTTPPDQGLTPQF